MFKVFIVEDEPLIRKGMLQMIEWNKLGFEVVGEAADGELAWPLIQELQPDIVITDIRMPFMDGLALSQMIKHSFPETNIIILSGYDEFEYAQKAISIGVEHYALKPITKAQLTELLVKFRNKRAKLVETQKSYTKIHEEAFKRKEHIFFEELMTGSKEVSSLIEQAKSLDLDIVKDRYKLLMVMLQPKDSGVLANYSWNIIHRIKDEMIKHLCKLGNIYAYQSSSEITVFLLAENQNFEKISYNAELKILNSFEQEYDDLLFLIATSEPFNRLSGVPEYYALGRTRLLERWWKIRTGQLDYSYNPPRINSVLKVDKLEQEDTILERAVDDGTEQTLPFDNIPLEWSDSTILTRFLSEGLHSQVDSFVENMISNVTEDQWKRRSLVQYMFLSTHLTIQAFIHELEEASAVENIQLPATFETKPTKESLREYVQRSLHKVIEARDQKIQNRYYGVIKEATSFIQQQFKDTDLRVSEIANYVGMSPAHFTTIFSQETGKTVIEYITEVRMGEARILLRTTTKTLYEIATEVGYSDASYFNRLFKKHHNMSPGSYRKGVS